MTIDLVSTLCDLVRIPSVNPMGRELQGEIYLEHRLTNYLDELFQRLGVARLRQTMLPNRENIVARFDGAVPPEQGGPLLLLEAHQDTVPVDGMIIDPFGATIRDGRVYGRGACDIKGGMASMLWAFARLVSERPANAPTVIIACTVNEEQGSDGAMKLAELWSPPHRFFGKRPDMAIVAEPTRLKIVVAHKGVLRWRLRTHGRAVHSSNPDQGENAIFQMGHLLRGLETYAREVVPALGVDRWVGRPSFSVGLISGGISVNTVPDACQIDVDRRLLPSESPVDAFHHALRYCEEHLNVTVTHQRPYLEAYGLSDDANGLLAEKLSRHARVFGGGEWTGVAFGTNAPPYAMSGVPTVVFGPGSIEQAHTCDEWVAVDELQAAGEILYRFLLDGDR